MSLKPTEASDGRWDVPGVDSPIAGDGGGTSPVPNHDDALKGTRQDLRHFLSSVAPSGREPSNQATPPPPPLSANLPPSTTCDDPGWDQSRGLGACSVDARSVASKRQLTKSTRLARVGRRAPAADSLHQEPTPIARNQNDSNVASAVVGRPSDRSSRGRSRSRMPCRRPGRRSWPASRLHASTRKAPPPRRREVAHPSRKTRVSPPACGLLTAPWVGRGAGPVVPRCFTGGH